VQNEESAEGIFSPADLNLMVELPRPSRNEPGPKAVGRERARPVTLPGTMAALGRIGSFVAVIIILAFALNAVIASGLRRIKTSQFGVTNRIMQGRVNAQIVITGSSRAVSHYDPRLLEASTGLSAFNLGRNGSQTDMQVAVLRAYLEHNRKPELVIHNLDAFSFVTTRGAYDPVQYVPYLYDKALYNALCKIDKDLWWRCRYVPLYGYVVPDMRLNWLLGLQGFFGWSPREDFFLGFNPRSGKWTSDFQNFKAANPHGVSWGIEPAGIQIVEDLIRVCHENGIQLIFVYSPEYSGMQKLTNNRAEIFGYFRDFSIRYHVPFWDYSDWKYAADTDYFANSQHLNADGAEIFSADLADRLKEYFAAQSETAALQSSK
jgi:hypothetical protein